MPVETYSRLLPGSAAITAEGSSCTSPSTLIDVIPIGGMERDAVTVTQGSLAVVAPGLATILAAYYRASLNTGYYHSRIAG